MKKNYLYVLFLLFFTSIESLACINYYGHTMEGKKIYSEFFFLSRAMTQHNVKDLNQQLEMVSAQIKREPDNWKAKSDRAALWLQLGKVQEALETLQLLNQEHPGEYTLISNLGTAYELVGQLDSALFYIKKSYAINPTSHRGSEWIHVAILKAKLQQTSRPNWIAERDILNADSLVKKITRKSSGHAMHPLTAQLIWQIETRVKFVSIPDETVSSLLFTLGQLYDTKHHTFEDAFIAYAYALRYSGSEIKRARIKEKLEALNKEREENIDHIPVSDDLIEILRVARLNLDLLTFHIQDYSDKKDSIRLVNSAKEDSLHSLQQKIDSLEQKVQLNAMERTNSPSINPWLIGVLGVFIGASLLLLLLKFTKRKI